MKYYTIPCLMHLAELTFRGNICSATVNVLRPAAEASVGSTRLWNCFLVDLIMQIALCQLRAQPIEALLLYMHM
jgi:hypothetical protein